MKKIILLCIAFAFLASCGQGQTAPTIENTETQTETQTESYKKILEASSKKITETPEFNSCITPYVNMCIQSSATDLARSNSNIDLCGELSTDSEKSACQLGVILATMTENHDHTKCEVITDVAMQMSCKSTIVSAKAQANNNKEMCQELKNFYPENEDEGNYAKDNCLMQIMLSTDTSKKEECNAIVTENIRNMCQESLQIRQEIIQATSTGSTSTGTTESTTPQK